MENIVLSLTSAVSWQKTQDHTNHRKKKEKKRKKHTVADFPFDEEVTKLECLQTL